MTVGELISELQKFDTELNVMAVGECAERVLLEKTLDGKPFVRIIEGIDAEFVLGSAGLKE